MSFELGFRCGVVLPRKLRKRPKAASLMKRQLSADSAYFFFNHKSKIKNHKWSAATLLPLTSYLLPLKFLVGAQRLS